MRRRSAGAGRLRAPARARDQVGSGPFRSLPPGTVSLRLPGQIFNIRDPSIEPSTGAMKTYSAKPETVTRNWYVVDAQGKTLGRLAAGLASRLRGKHKPEYTPHVDTGDYIVVVNAEKIRVTGRKLSDKMYHHHTGYIGSLKSESLQQLLARAPEQALTLAVKGMLPRGPLGRQMLKKLKVVSGNQHPHEAQQPAALEI